MQVLRGVLQNPVDDLVHQGLAADVVIIVEYEYERLFDRAKDLVDQKVRGPLGESYQFFIRIAEVGKEGIAKIWRDLSDTMRNIIKENYWIGIGMVELIPN